MSRKNERGAALVEAAVTIPILLLIAVGIFEFGRAYQTWQVLTNAAREGARISVTPSGTVDNVTTAVRQYLQDGALDKYADAVISVDRGVPFAAGTAGSPTASLITIQYPFEFIVLQPIAQLIVPGSSTGAPITMGATALMRNEAP
jgi:Flp pilus assembly protein TadG